ncbi:MAG: hypothetical protein MJE77_37810 [Proteobacteria bacterium]|nr:hypothetical protein [Pseudomonadota bacterium]
MSDIPKKPDDNPDEWKPTKDNIGSMINGALKTHLQRQEKAWQESQQKAIAEGIAAAFAEDGPAAELLRTMVPETPAPKEKPTEDSGVKAQMEAMRAEFDKRQQALEKQLEAQKTAREEAERRFREKELDDAVRAQLLQNGCDPKLASAALKLAKENVKRTDDGLVWTRDDALQPEVALADGVKEWIGSETGQIFLPARQVAGSGNRGGGKPPGKDHEYTDAELGALLANRPGPGQ